MSYSKRLVARIDVKGNRLIKGLRFEGLRVLGDPLHAVERYASLHIDEIFFVDAVASLYGRNSLFDILRECTRRVFVPITAGGGIRSSSDVHDLLISGADKVAINTAAVQSPSLLSELVERFGSQCIVSSIQARRSSRGKWDVMTESGRDRSGIDLFDWVLQVQKLGVGEIFLTSVDQDGTCLGPDCELISAVSKLVNVPLVVGGGFSSLNDFNFGFSIPQVSGIAAGASFHKNLLNPAELKQALPDFLQTRHYLASYASTEVTLAGLKIGIVDYGIGNQQSLHNALVSLDANVISSNSIPELSCCDFLFLPGVGAFKHGISQLHDLNLSAFLRNWSLNHKPLIGICLGMQMLFESSDEFGFTQGLSLIPGQVKLMLPNSSGSSNLSLPHVGWTRINNNGSEIPSTLSNHSFYFVHSFSATMMPESMILASALYGAQSIAAIVRNRRTLGFQFHPERSGQAGLHLLSYFVRQLLT